MSNIHILPKYQYSAMSPYLCSYTTPDTPPSVLMPPTD